MHKSAAVSIECIHDPQWEVSAFKEMVLLLLTNVASVVRLGEFILVVIPIIGGGQLSRKSSKPKSVNLVSW